MLVDEVAVRPGWVAQCDQDAPGQGDGEEQEGAAWQVDRPEALPLPEGQQPQKHHRTCQDKADEPLGQGRQGRADVQVVEIAPALRSGRLPDAEDKREQGAAQSAVIVIARTSFAISSPTVCSGHSARGIWLRACVVMNPVQATVRHHRERAVMIAVDEILNPVEQVERRRDDNRIRRS